MSDPQLCLACILLGAVNALPAAAQSPTNTATTRELPTAVTTANYRLAENSIGLRDASITDLDRAKEQSGGR